jgi:hypothetical protein
MLLGFQSLLVYAYVSSRVSVFPYSIPHSYVVRAASESNEGIEHDNGLSPRRKTFSETILGSARALPSSFLLAWVSQLHIGWILMN